MAIRVGVAIGDLAFEWRSAQGRGRISSQTASSGDGILIGQSWTHKLARPLVRPLVGTGITPNHITTARLITGLMASALLLPGDVGWTWWAGWMWLLSALLDRADG